MKGGTGAQAGVEEVKGGSGGGSGRGGFGSNCSERRAGGSTPISFKVFWRWRWMLCIEKCTPQPLAASVTGPGHLGMVPLSLSRRYSAALRAKTLCARVGERSESSTSRAKRTRRQS